MDGRLAHAHDARDFLRVRAGVLRNCYKDRAGARRLQSEQRARRARIHRRGDDVTGVALGLDQGEEVLRDEVSKMMLDVAIAGSDPTDDLREVDARVRLDERDDLLSQGVV